MITEFQDGFITKSKLNEMVGEINMNSNGVIGMTANETIYVGVGQTYITLSSALDYAKNRRPNKDYKIEIIIKSGTIISEQLIYENADFGHVIISSEDVEVNIDVSGFTIAKVGSYKPFFYLSNGNCPLINTILKGNDVFENSAIKYLSVGFVLNNSYLKINDSKGVYNFGYGIHANMSKIIAYNCNIKNYIPSWIEQITWEYYPNIVFFNFSTMLLIIFGIFCGIARHMWSVLKKGDGTK